MQGCEVSVRGSLGRSKASYEEMIDRGVCDYLFTFTLLSTPPLAIPLTPCFNLSHLHFTFTFTLAIPLTSFFNLSCLCNLPTRPAAMFHTPSGVSLVSPSPTDRFLALQDEVAQYVPLTSSHSISQHR
jgi:hypothetical protein